MIDILEKICATTREHVSHAKQQHSLNALDILTKAASPVRGFTPALYRKIALDGLALITEIKKASPSAGIICTDFSPAALAQDYEQAGAACLSVLTDITYFQGNNDDLIAARAACTLPVLRKDFMIDVWQVAEARAIGADCILIIMAAVDDALAKDLHQAATGYHMDVLIETHNREELERALRLPSGLIGINNRNLKTLQIDLATTEELAPLVPQDRLLVCESGMRNKEDITRMKKAGASCFLIGESLLKQGDVATAVTRLRV